MSHVTVQPIGALTGCVDQYGAPIKFGATITIDPAHLAFVTPKWLDALRQARAAGAITATVEHADNSSDAFMARPFVDKSLCLYWENDGDPCWDVFVTN